MSEGLEYPGGPAKDGPGGGRRERKVGEGGEAGGRGRRKNGGTE